MKLARNENGTLPEFAWPGGYPLFYLDGENSLLCAKCATKSLDDEIETFRPVACDVYWEGESMQCDRCNVEIDSAYGIPES